MLNHPLTDPPAGGDTAVVSRTGNEPGSGAGPLRRQVLRLAIFVVLLSACFAQPLGMLTRYSLHSEFFSYIVLIPVISLYLIWTKRTELPAQAVPAWKLTALPALGGLAVLVACKLAMHHGKGLFVEDYLTLMTASYLMFVVAGCLGFLGRAVWRVILFPVLFLAFMIPMPSGMLDRTTLFFQNTSASAASWMLSATGTPHLLMGLNLSLPAMQPIYIAPQCSGIHSTMVLLITAFLAGHLFLRSTWKRALLVAFVFALAIVRNGFRIYTISELCVHISPDMIDSPIHHRGGPIFFILSLFPFFALLFLLRKFELRGAKTATAAANP